MQHADIPAATVNDESPASQERRRRKAILSGLRLAIFVRDAGLCQYCGDLGVALDHIVPHSLGGSDTYENLVLSCTRCNSTASNRLFDDFEQKRAWVLSRRGADSDGWQRMVLEVCIDCFRAFRPHVGAATAFLCADCATDC